MIKNFLKKIIPDSFLKWYYQLFPLLGALLYRFPSKRLVVIGVTGTNGKSTVVQLITDILKQAGFNVASVSSIRFQIKEKEWQNKLKMTMPGRLSLQRFLRRAVNQGCQYVILEVTSEGIKQFRHKFINFDLAVFTNLTKEHIESHKGFENYRQAKGELFKISGLKVSVINLDDKNAEYFLQFKAKEKWGYRIRKEEEEGERKERGEGLKIVEAENIKMNQEGSSFEVRPLGERDAKKEDLKFKIHLLGEFNIYNALAAICVGLSQGISLEIIKEALETTKGIAGRMEMVIEKPFKVYVDYAHTPDALRNVYKTLAGSRLICVLGSCGGGRDKWKRPELGKVAADYCSQIILTNEDPYDEDPQKILKDIEKGVLEYKMPTVHHRLIFNRRGAIKKALTLANPGDTVVITGKGGEPWMCVAHGKKIPWDDRKVVKEEFNKLKIFDKSFS